MTKPPSTRRGSSSAKWATRTSPSSSCATSISGRSARSVTAVYLQLDAKDETLQAYGERVIPALADTVLAKT